MDFQGRLTARQREALMHAIGACGLPTDSSVFLFGSRADPDAAGGDVDLLVYASGVDRYQLERNIRREYCRMLDERIDVLVIDPKDESPAEGAFLKTIRKVPIR